MVAAAGSSSSALPEKNIIDRVKEDLTCPVCFELFEKAVALFPCGHMLDEECVSKVEDCPLCRAEIIGFSKTPQVCSAVEHLLHIKSFSPEQVVIVETEGSENPEDSYQLGYRYFHGKDSPKDRHEALYHYTHAAKQGHVEAQLALGIIYYKGDGCKADLKKARDYFTLATAQGNREAHDHLRMMATTPLCKCNIL